MHKNHTNSDTAWKEILDAYFPDFLAYCLPQLHALIDWDKPWESLDKELYAITKAHLIGKRILDKLFKVYLKSGQEQWILLHIEVQGKPEKYFPERMFVYTYRIFDKHQQLVISCAILTDDSFHWRPNRYEMGLAGSKTTHEFIVVKLLDYEDRREELEQSSNIFASVILCQLDALKNKYKSSEERLKIKYNLTRRLYNKGYTAKQIKDLYIFIDWLIHLPKPLEIEYHQQIYQFEKERKMAYVSTAERLGIEKGLSQGLVQGRQEGESNVLIRQLTRKFGAVPVNYQERIQQADSEILLIWSEQLLDAKVIDEVFA